MESYRTKMPLAEGLGETERPYRQGTGALPDEPPQAGVAQRLAVVEDKGRVLAWFYVKDRDCKLRYIAIQAVIGATKAYPSGISVGWVLDTTCSGRASVVGSNLGHRPLFSKRIGRGVRCTATGRPLDLTLA